VFDCAADIPFPNEFGVFDGANPLARFAQSPPQRSNHAASLFEMITKT
jgi:hypothetical protein